MDEATQTVARAPTIAELVNRADFALQKTLSNGDIARLRRLKPGQVAGSVLWRLIPEEALPSGEPALVEAELRWSAVLSAMALAKGLHARGRRPGVALAEAGLSELRLSRLLEARGERLLGEIRSLGRLLNAKAVTVDWSDVAWLVFGQDSDRHESSRRNVARDYYRTLHALERRPSHE